MSVAVVESEENKDLLRTVLKVRQCVVYPEEDYWERIKVVCMKPVCKDAELTKCVSCYSARNPSEDLVLKRNRTIALFRNHPALIHLMLEVRVEGDH